MKLDTPGWMSRERVTVAWLSAVTLLVVVGWLHDRQFRRELSTQPSRAELAALIRRVEETEAELQALKQQPTSVSAKAFADARGRIEERLARFERLNSDAVSTQDFSDLQKRVETVEARTAQAHRSVPSAQSLPPSTPAAPVEPPFQLLGTELRGGELFLSLLPAGARSLGQVHVLRPGDSEGAWQLESIDRGQASFRVNGQVRLLHVP